MLAPVVVGTLRGCQGSDFGFSLCAYLLTLSEYFQWDQTLDLGVKSETSLHRSEHRRVMKLEVQPLEPVFRVDIQDDRGKALKYRYSNRYWMCASHIKDGS